MIFRRWKCRRKWRDQGWPTIFILQKYGNRAIFSLDPNALEASKAGLIIEEAIGSGWVATSRIEMGFDPLPGELADGVKVDATRKAGFLSALSASRS